MRLWCVVRQKSVSSEEDEALLSVRVAYRLAGEVEGSTTACHDRGSDGFSRAVYCQPRVRVD